MRKQRYHTFKKTSPQFFNHKRHRKTLSDFPKIPKILKVD